MKQKRESKPARIEFIDTTLREGLQSPLWNDYGKFYITTEDKLEIVEKLIRYGVKFIEVFSPIVGEREASDLKQIIGKKETVCQELNKKVSLLVHVRCHPEDVETALKYPVDGLNFYIGTSSFSQKYNHGKDLSQIIKMTKPLIREVRKKHPRLLLRFGGEDAFRTPLKDLFTVYDSLVGLVDRFSLPDTVGIASPEEVEERVLEFKKRYPKVGLEGHFHNERGLSLINALTAIEAGMDFINTSVLGLGERSGITSLTALVFNLYLKDPGLVKDLDLSSSYALNVFLAKIMNMHVPPTEPISLTNRTHAAGVHAQAVLKSPTAYEAHFLRKFGVTQRRLLLGPLSGRHIVGYFLTEILKFVVEDEKIIEEITNEFKKRAVEADSKKTPSKILKQLALEYRLPQRLEPKTHIEKLD